MSNHHTPVEKPNIPAFAALWTALLIIGLVIAAINFVQVMSHSDDHGHHETTEHAHGAHGTHDTPSH